MKEEQPTALAVVGQGLEAIATMVRLAVETVPSVPSGGPPVSLVLVKGLAGNRRSFDENASYPYSGQPEKLHPFLSEKPPEPFFTYAIYYDAMKALGVELHSSRSDLTYGDVFRYLEFLLETVVSAFEALVRIEVIDTPVVQRTLRLGGTEAFSFADGTQRVFARVSNAAMPPYMGNSAAGRFGGSQ